ncbi:DNA-binding protein [Agathobaculum massiliense]|uniref:DNA-binding protein n=1 Tax=Agathobaculum massiliense TaxID=3014267 RepID=UPI00131DFEB3|nr:DNA-binding protein [Agathobaculum massiliense]
MTTNIPRMRFPAQALAELKQADPQTPVTLNLIRSLIRRGVIPCIEVGRGKLLNYDDLLDYLAAAPTGPQPTTAGIRRIPE